MQSMPWPRGISRDQVAISILKVKFIGLFNAFFTHFYTNTYNRIDSGVAKKRTAFVVEA